VPLVFYKRDSYFSEQHFTTARKRLFRRNEEFQNVDLATTVSALLGVPVPRQSLGRFIDEVMWLLPPDELEKTYFDLFRQKQTLVKHFLVQLGVEVAGSDGSDSKYKELLYEKRDGHEVEEYVDWVKELLLVYEEERQAALDQMIARNIVLTVVINLMILAGVLYVMQRYTFCDLTGICYLDAPLSVSVDPDLSLPDVPIEDRTRSVKAGNWKALMLSLLAVSVYYGLSIGLFLALYQSYGYMPEIWDSTYVHTPGVIPRFLASTLFMAGLSEFIMIRFYSVWLTNYQPPPLSYDQQGELRMTSAVTNVLMFVAYLLTGYRQKYKNLGVVYLLRHYLVLMTIFACMVLFTLGGTYTFVLPYVFEIKFIDENIWAFRFRVLTVQFMTIPLIIGNLVVLRLWPKGNLNSAELDGIYRLKVYKDLRTHWWHVDYKHMLAPVAVLLDKITTNPFEMEGVHSIADLLKPKRK